MQREAAAGLCWGGARAWQHGGGASDSARVSGRGYPAWSALTAGGMACVRAVSVA